MFLSILGWFWIITGALFLLRPDMLRRRLQKKSTKIVKRYLFVIILFFASMLVAAGLKAHGVPAKIIMILGVIGVFKGLFLLRAKASDKIGSGLREMLVVALVDSNRFSVVELQDLDSVKKKQELSSSEATDTETNIEKGKTMTADLILSAVVTEFEPQSSGGRAGVGGGGRMGTDSPCAHGKQVGLC